MDFNNKGGVSDGVDSNVVVTCEYSKDAERGAEGGHGQMAEGGRAESELRSEGTQRVRGEENMDVLV